jgi:hypothetical protein
VEVIITHYPVNGPVIDHNSTESGRFAPNFGSNEALEWSPSYETLFEANLSQEIAKVGNFAKFGNPYQITAAKLTATITVPAVHNPLESRAPTYDKSLEFRGPLSPPV